ncbi:MAG: alpha/beta hydrolase [Paracoccaceae bacterium]
MTQPDYDTLIDAETQAFIRATAACYPDDTAGRSIADQRAIYDGMCRVFHRGYPPGVTARDEGIAGVPCRIYPGSGGTVLYLHGGGFVVGGLRSHDDVCAEIRAETGLTVIAADYRLSPEHDHPAAFDDCLAVARAITDRPLILAGDSAGGNLCAAVAQADRSLGLAGMVLIYPGLGGDKDKGSYLVHAHAPMLTRDDVLFYGGIRHGGTAPTRPGPTVEPLSDTDFSRLPPVLAISAECDPLADDARDYAAKITAAGGRAHWVQEPGLVHGYLRGRTHSARIRASYARIMQALTAFARGEWPYGDAS